MQDTKKKSVYHSSRLTVVEVIQLFDNKAIYNTLNALVGNTEVMV